MTRKAGESRVKRVKQFYALTIDWRGNKIITTPKPEQE